MLTILAWMVFIPAVVWNMTLFMVAISDIFGQNRVHWFTKRNMRDLALSLVILFVPGVYLFGLF
jgi:hypothetical protein